MMFRPMPTMSARPRRRRTEKKTNEEKNTPKLHSRNLAITFITPTEKSIFLFFFIFLGKKLRTKEQQGTLLFFGGRQPDYSLIYIYNFTLKHNEAHSVQ
jgi:hypothetical protein